MFYDSEWNSFFVLASGLDCRLMVSVSDYSLFDIEYNAFNTYASNIDTEMDKSNKLKKKEYDFNLDDEDSNYGRYSLVMRRLLTSLLNFYWKILMEN